MNHKCMSQARMWLDLLRNGTDQYDAFIYYIRKEIHKGNLSLTDIGTSEEELEELRIKGCKIAANRWLNYLRIDAANKRLDKSPAEDHRTPYQKGLAFLARITPDKFNLIIGYVREEARKGNFSLADIGTSEEELASFVMASA